MSPTFKPGPTSVRALHLLFGGVAASNSEPTRLLLLILQFRLIHRLTDVGEYGFQTDIRALTVQARDGHFAFSGDATELFFFLRKTAVVSVSSDGLALPQIYALGEYRLA